MTGHLRPSLVAAAVLLTLGTATPEVTEAQLAPGLTGRAALQSAYDAIFDARFDEMPAILARTCPPGPSEACKVLEAVSVWWEIQLDPRNVSRDGVFQTRIEAAITATDAWAVRDPSRAEAWFYVGGAYGARAQWRVLRGQRIGAARDGKRIKEALERALTLDPRLQEANFGIGLYRYYADVAPAAAKMLRWLLLLPGGDRVAGLQQMLRARSEGALLRDEADYQLQTIYLWYERQPERALELLGELRQRHPRNPLFPQSIAEVQDQYLHDLSASLQTWQDLLEAARSRRVAAPALAETNARLGAALQLDRLSETDRAIEYLRAVVAARPTEPQGALAQAERQLRQATDRMQDAGYRASLEGWRALQRGDVATAGRLLPQALSARRDDPFTRLRNAQLRVAQRNDASALTLLDQIFATASAVPPTVYASACLEAAGVYERLHDTVRAVDLYRMARGTVGADARTRDAATRALARLAL